MQHIHKKKMSPGHRNRHKRHALQAKGIILLPVKFKIPYSVYALGSKSQAYGVL